jgi:hypothetical protein
VRKHWARHRGRLRRRPYEMRTMIASEITRWKQVIKDTSIPQQ